MEGDGLLPWTLPVSPVHSLARGFVFGGEEHGSFIIREIGILVIYSSLQKDQLLEKYNFLLIKIVLE